MLQALLLQVGLRHLKFLQDQCLLFDRSSKQLTPSAPLHHETRSKLQSKTVRPFHIMCSTPDTVTIDEDGLHNTSQTYHVTGTADETDAKNRTNKRHTHKNMREPSPARLSRNEETNEAEYPFEKIIRHIRTRDNIRYVFHWYGYQPRDYNAKPPHHTQKHFISRNWRRRNRWR